MAYKDELLLEKAEKSKKKNVSNYKKKKKISGKTCPKLKWKKFTNNLNGYNFLFA